MKDEEFNALAERDPEAAADAFYRSMGGGRVNDAPDTDWDALLAATPRRPPHFAWRIAGGFGRAFGFVLYCILTFLRPVVRFAAGALAFFFGLGAVVMFFMYGKGFWTCLGVAGAGVACIAVREIYDSLVIRFAPRDRGVFLN